MVTDSGCDLPQALAEELGIRIVPLTVRFGRDELVDRQDLTPSEFWARCATTADPPETAAPAPGLFEATYRALADSGAGGIVVISLSGVISGTAQSAQLAAHGVADVVRIEVVDSRSVTTGLGMIAVAAARLARTGASLDEVGALARGLVPRTHVLGTLASLEYLRRSGRVGGGKARLASALRIRPIIEVREGRVEEAGWKRTRARALQALVDAVEAAGPLEALAAFHAEATDVDGFVSRLAPMAPGPVMVTDVGAVIGAHCGLGAIGVAYETRS